MSVDLLAIHVIFIIACAYFSYVRGRTIGSEATVEVFLEKKLITEQQLIDTFGQD